LADDDHVVTIGDFFLWLKPTDSFYGTRITIQVIPVSTALRLILTHRAPILVPFEIPP